MSKQRITVLKDKIKKLREQYISIIDEESESGSENNYTTSYLLAANLSQSIKLLKESYQLQEKQAEKILLFASMQTAAIDCVNQLQSGADAEDLNSLLLLGSFLIGGYSLLPANPNSSLRRAHEYLTEASNQGSLNAVLELAKIHSINPYLKGVGTLTEKCQWFLDSKDEFSKHTEGNCECGETCNNLSKEFDIKFKEFIHSQNNRALNDAMAEICCNDENTTKDIKYLSYLIESKYLASNNGVYEIENLVTKKIEQSVTQLNNAPFIKQRLRKNTNYSSEGALASFVDKLAQENLVSGNCKF